jgi:hypothetical protein
MMASNPIGIFLSFGIEAYYGHKIEKMISELINPTPDDIYAVMKS